MKKPKREQAPLKPMTMGQVLGPELLEEIKRREVERARRAELEAMGFKPVQKTT